MKKDFFPVLIAALLEEEEEDLYNPTEGKSFQQQHDEGFLFYNNTGLFSDGTLQISHFWSKRSKLKVISAL